jgi:UDP-N-acetylglucosamine--N-acetylmuramyl-(pentapeptide) pyrophosphoryl-undecaprenol N-acetylglucosamine transferase
VKLIVSGGGTGGHVYPALTVIETLLLPKRQGIVLPTPAPEDVLWIGSRGGMEEELIKRQEIDFVGLAAGGVRGLGPLRGGRNILQILRSVGPAQKILDQFAADVLLVTGGYASVSVALAARRAQVPIIIYLPDIVPGLAIRFLSRFATRIAVTNEESLQFFPRTKVTVTGYPVRAEIYGLDRRQARLALDLDPEAKTLLIFGGSRGARSINRATVAGLRELLPVCQVLHISGRLDTDWVAGAAKSLPQELAARYHHYTYLHDMPPALVAADLVVARAGASTMGEFPAAGLPAVLVPYPHSGQHQLPNAEYMARNGAAQVLLDGALEKEMVPTILALLADEQTLDSMGEAARAMARRDAAEAIAAELWQAARRRSGEGSEVRP